MKVRIGIDVGGTFTDVVVIDGQTHELVGQLKLPTTHSAREGVAPGIVTALERAMEEFGLQPDDVAFIAHSATQATNALLEGDVAEVGVAGVGERVDDHAFRRRRDERRRSPSPSDPDDAFGAGHRDRGRADARTGCG
jgi:N-methylhydantoinase A/oxoprolinase/acetone carboxylase beta subunit